MYNYNHLFYFYITAKSGSVTAAAKHLTISQPSLSSQLKVFEGVLDMKLFKKVGRVNELTRSGHFVFGYCKKMFEVSEAMSEAILQKIPSETRRIHIGVSDEVDRPIVVEVISAFLKNLKHKERPKVVVVAGTHEQLVEKIRFREIDVMISENAMKDPDLMNLSRVEVPVLLVCSNKWKLKNNLKTKELTTELRKISDTGAPQWVMPSAKFKLRSEIDIFFEEHQLKGRIVFESDVMSSIVRSVVDEIGVAFLPLLYIGNFIQNKSIRVLGSKKGYWKYRVWLVCDNQNYKDPLIQLFSEAFKTVCGNIKYSS